MSQVVDYFLQSESVLSEAFGLETQRTSELLPFFSPPVSLGWAGAYAYVRRLLPMYPGKGSMLVLVVGVWGNGASACLCGSCAPGLGGA